MALLLGILAFGFLRRKRALQFFGKTSSYAHPLLLSLILLLITIGRGEPSYFDGTKKTVLARKATLFILDNSLSMTVKDTSKGESRLTVGKQLFDLVLKGQEGSWIALAILNGDIEVLAPLTIDIPITRLLLDQIDPAGSGTNFLKGFRTLYDSFESGHPPTQILLASDGEAIPPMDEEQHRELLELVKNGKIPISTIGLGSPKGGVIPDLSKISVPDFNLLAEIAEATSGIFYKVGDKSLLSLSQTIQNHQLQNEEATGSIERVSKRLSPYFYLLAALVTIFALRLNPR